MVEPYKPLYKVTEVAKLLKTSPRDVYDRMNCGELPYIVLGSRKVKGVDLERYINSYPQEPGNVDAVGKG